MNCLSENPALNALPLFLPLYCPFFCEKKCPFFAPFFFTFAPFTSLAAMPWSIETSDVVIVHEAISYPSRLQICRSGTRSLPPTVSTFLLVYQEMSTEV